jgi:hypothetical protein
VEGGKADERKGMFSAFRLVLAIGGDDKFCCRQEAVKEERRGKLGF